MGLPKLILAPVDFSEHSHASVRVAADYASQLGAELLLVHAVPAIPKLPSPATIFREAEYEAELRKEADRGLQALARTWRRRVSGSEPKSESPMMSEWKSCVWPSTTTRI